MSRERTGAIFVIGQFVLIALIVLLPSGSAWPVPGWLSVLCVVLALAGIAVMVLAALALGPGLTAMPIPNDRAKLRTSGVFGWVRHPIYSGLLLAAIAWTVRSGSVWTLAACAVFLAWMNAKARWEESRLRERFPDYDAYATSTGRFVPRVRG